MARPKPFSTEQRTRLFDWRGAIVDSALPPMTRLVALVLSLHMNRAGESCFPGTALLMAQTRLGKSAVLEHVKSLLTLGWLEAEKEHGRGAPRRYIARFPTAVVDAIIAAATAPSEPSAVTDSSPDAATVHEPSTNRPPGRTPLTKEDVEDGEDVKHPPAEPAGADTWLTPYLKPYKDKVGVIKPGRLAAALKPVHDEAGGEKTLALWIRWCGSDKTGFGPEWFAANWRKADRTPGQARPTATVTGKDYGDGMTELGRQRPA